VITTKVVRLHWQLTCARALLWVASASSTCEATPEVHLYLSDLHLKLAAEYDSAGRSKAARRHRRVAASHAILGTPPPSPRPAAAMAMPVPQPPIFTDARGTQIELEPPDDIA